MMDKSYFKELERLFLQYQENPSKENAWELKDFLKYCAKTINIREHKSRQLKFK